MKSHKNLQHFSQIHILGLSGVVGSSTKIALYISKALKALSSLGKTLQKNILTMWKIAKITTKIAKLCFKGFTLGGSQVSDKSEVNFFVINAKTRSPGCACFPFFLQWSSLHKFLFDRSEHHIHPVDTRHTHTYTHRQSSRHDTRIRFYILTFV